MLRRLRTHKHATYFTMCNSVLQYMDVTFYTHLVYFTVRQETELGCTSSMATQRHSTTKQAYEKSSHVFSHSERAAVPKPAIGSGGVLQCKLPR